MLGSFERPIDPEVYPRLRLEDKLIKGPRKTSYWDTQTKERYFVKKYLLEKEYRARQEELGLVLCQAYGAITPGHILIYDKGFPVLIQRMVPYQHTLGTYYRDHMSPTQILPNELERAQLLSEFSVRQVTEVMVCWVMDYLTYNWDAHPDNFLIDRMGGNLVGIDRCRTAHFIEHPHLLLESPKVEGDLVHYVARVSKPADNVMGHIYEPVWTNIYRKVYKPDLNRISTVLNLVESLDDTYDGYIRAVLDGSGLEAFIKRRETVRQAVDKLFSILELEL